MRTRFDTFSAPLTLAALAGLATTASAGPTILDAAPTDAALIIHVPSLEDARNTWADSALRAFATDPAIKPWIDSLLSENAEGLVDLLDAWEELTEEIEPPTGSLGLASAIRAIDGNQESSDVAIVDWGDAAEDAEDRLVEWLEEQEDEDELVLRDERFGDLRLWIAEPAEGWDEEDDDDWDDDVTDAIEAQLDMPWDRGTTTYFTRLDGTLLATTSRDAIELAIESLEGRDRETLADVAAVRDAIGWMPEGSTVQIVINPAPLLEVGDDESPGLLPDENARNIADALGITELEWIAAAASIDTEGELARLSGRVELTETRGLFGLIDADGRAVEPTPLASADTAIASRLLIDFDAVLPLAREVVAAFPPDERAEAEAGLNQAAAFAAPVLAALGPEVDIIANVNLPHSTTSRQQVFAIAVKDRQVVANTLGFGAGFVGATPEEFLGAQVFEVDGAPVSAGITDEWLLIGPSMGVRDAIRRVADGAMRGDAIDLTKLRSAAPARVSSTGVEKLERTVAQTLWSITNWEEATRDMVESLGMDWMDPAEMIEQRRDEAEKLARNAPGAEDILRHVSETTFWIAPVRGGFEFENAWHAPAN